jgi:murein L,D-transpeptidase YafK
MGFFNTINLLILATALLVSAEPNISISESKDSSLQKECPRKIRIYKSKRKLYLYNGNVAIDSANCSFGFGEYLHPGPKERSGDKKTPEGKYFVIEKHPSSKFFYFIGISYPNSEDAKRGFKKGLITQKQYSQIATADSNHTIPLQNTSLGGAIGIHGEKKLGPFSIGTQINWTRGCISLSNRDITRIYKLVRIGDEVEIIK